VGGVVGVRIARLPGHGPLLACLHISDEVEPREGCGPRFLTMEFQMFQRGMLSQTGIAIVAFMTVGTAEAAPGASWPAIGGGTGCDVLRGSKG
jgi:hypothetical protein